MDNGSQVTLVRSELLPKVKEYNGWTLEQCHQRNRPMETQPIEASGQELGATSVVAIGTLIEQTGQKLVIPCFVMTSARPIWQGAVHDCAMVLGTNALVSFGVQMILGDGNVMRPSGTDTTKHSVDSPKNGVFLVRAVRVAPGQSKVVEVKAICGKDDVGVVTPTESMANALCETLWTGSTEFKITLNHWEMSLYLWPKANKWEQLIQQT